MEDEDLAILEEENSVKSQSDAEETPLLKPKTAKKVVEKKPREKKPRSEKQIEATKKMREAYLIKAGKMKVEKEEQSIIKRKEKEDLILKKAVAIKKRELKEKAVIEEISDDDLPPEKVKIIKQKIEQKKKVLAKQPAPEKPLPPAKPTVQIIYM